MPGLSCLGLAVACSPAQVYVPLPTDDFESLILVLEERGKPTWVTALAAAPVATFTPALELEVEAATALEALVLDKSLAALGLAPGEVPDDPDGYCLPFQDSRIFRAPLQGDSSPGWIEETEPGAASLAVRFSAEEEPCAFPVVGSVSLATGEPVNVLVAAADGERLLAGSTQGLLVVNRAGEVSFEDPGAWCAAQKVLGTDRALVARCDGVVFEINLDRSPAQLTERFRVETGLNGERGIGTVAAHEVLGGLEVFMLTLEGRFLRYTILSGVEVLHTFDRAASPANYLGGLAIVGAGHALAGVESVAELIEHSGGVSRPVNFGADSGVSVIDHSESGTMVGTTTGGLWHRPIGAEDFRVLEPSPNQSWVVAVAPVGGGDYVYALTFGSVGLYEEGRGFCGPEILSAQSHRRMVPFGNGFAVTGQNAGLTRTPITLFDVQKSGRALKRDCGP